MKGDVLIFEQVQLTDRDRQFLAHQLALVDRFCGAQPLCVRCHKPLPSNPLVCALDIKSGRLVCPECWLPEEDRRA